MTKSQIGQRSSIRKRSDIGKRGNYGALFDNGTMDFAAGWLLGYAQQGGLSPGALLHCFAQITDGNPASWARIFLIQAERTRTWAGEAQARDAYAEAAQAWLATYVAERAALMLADPTTGQARALTESMQESFRAFLRTGDIALQPREVPFGATRLPAYATADLEGAPRAMVIIGGGDTYVEDLWFFGGKAAHEAGWPVLAVDLPGQGSTPYQGLHFGPDTLPGLRAVIDHLHQHGYAGELVLLGWSGGGIFVTKFASVARPEDKICAWVASTPIHDAEAMFANAIPVALRRDPDSALVRTLLWFARRNRVLRGSLAKYDWQFGPAGIAGVVKRFAELGRTDLTAIEAPVLALIGLDEDPEGMRQARTVVTEVSKRHPASDLITFDTATGAGSHCQVGNLPLAMTRVLDWLERTVMPVS